MMSPDDPTAASLPRAQLARTNQFVDRLSGDTQHRSSLVDAVGEPLRFRRARPVR